MGIRYRGKKNNHVSGPTYRTAGLDQLGPIRWHENPKIVYSLAPRRINNRAAISTAKRKVKITLAEHA